MKYSLIILLFLITKSAQSQNNAAYVNINKTEKNGVKQKLQLSTEFDSLIELTIPNDNFIEESVYADKSYVLHVGLVSKHTCILSAGYKIDGNWIQDYIFCHLSYIISGLSQTVIEKVIIIDGQTIEAHLVQEFHDKEPIKFKKIFTIDQNGLFDPDANSYNCRQDRSDSLTFNNSPRSNFSSKNKTIEVEK